MDPYAIPTKPAYQIIQVFPGRTTREPHEREKGRYCWCGPEVIHRFDGQAIVHRDTISHRFNLSVHFLYPCIRSDLRLLHGDTDKDY